MARTYEKQAFTPECVPEILKGTAFMEEAGADTFEISDLPFVPSGVLAHVLRSDDVAIAVDGTYTNGKAVVTLDADCYHVAGRLSVAIYITDASMNSQCVYACVGNVYRTVGDTELDSGTEVPTLAQLEAAYQACISATQQATNAVSYVEQTGKTDAQKAQARTNIGAASEDDVTDLKGAISGIGVVEPSNLDQWLYATDKYLNASFELTDLSGYNTYRIPVDQLDFVVIKWVGDNPFGTLNSNYCYALEDSNGMRRDLGTENYYVSTSEKHLGFVAPSDSVAVYFTFQATSVPNNLSIVKNNAFEYSPKIDYQSGFVLPINSLTAFDPKLYLNGSAKISNWANAEYHTWWLKVKAGDTIAFEENESELNVLAYYIDATGTRYSITSLSHTFSADAAVVAFEKTDKANNITLSQNALKLRIGSQNVLGLKKAIDDELAEIASEVETLEQDVTGIQNRLDGVSVDYTTGAISGKYCRLVAGSTTEIEIKDGSNFSYSKLEVQEWMHEVDFSVLSVTGINSSAIYCGFADEDNLLISRNPIAVGQYKMPIPSNAKYVYLNFFGSTYCEGYTIKSDPFAKNSQIEQLQAEIDDLDIASPFDGLTGVAFGTSLTYRAQTTYGYLQYLPDLSGITFDNQGIGSSYIYGNMLTAIKAYTGYAGKRVCLLEGFVNDWYNNKTLGTWKDNTETSVCGCVRSALNYMLSQNANLTVFLILDPYGRNYSNVDCSTTAVNGAGLTQFEYYEEIAKVAESLGIPVIKEYAESQISENTPQYLVDNIHPTALGAKQSANCIWSAMRGHVPNSVS